MRVTALKNLQARQILNSLGYPTIEVEATTIAGQRSVASVPSSGLRVSSFAPQEKRDGKSRVYGGRGVTEACGIINTIVKDTLKKVDVTNQEAVDKKLIDLDKKSKKNKLGANTMLGVSMVLAKLGAKSSGQGLFEHLRSFALFSGPGWQLPTPIFTLVSGGRFNGANFDLRAVTVAINNRTRSGNLREMSDIVRMAAKVFHEFGRVLQKHGLTLAVGVEGGYVPEAVSSERILTFVREAVRRTKLRLGNEVGIGIEVDAESFYDSKKQNYFFQFDDHSLSNEEWLQVCRRWVEKYKVTMIEDGFSVSNWAHWEEASKFLGKKIILSGDDLVATNFERLKEAVNKEILKSVCVRPLQAATVTGALQFAMRAKAEGLSRIVATEPEETEDDFIVDFGVALGAEYLKLGGLNRGERVSKYNRLLLLADKLKVV